METTATLNPAPATTLSETDSGPWSNPVPLHHARLAGDPAEPHIFRGLD
ncbi:hypothetical protein [Streptomyces sp. NBC_01190]|nr:hypothetical protein OG519_31080 [Streptomyces sp. NBC_01190]